MKETIPQSEDSESIVFVGTLVGFVELNDRPVTIKMELASLLAPIAIALFSREEL